MWHSAHICISLRCRNLLRYSLRFGYLTCRCICFAIMVFYRSEIYCPIFTLSSTMPSVLHILHWFIISLRCLFLLIRIRIIAILAHIPVHNTGSRVNIPCPQSYKFCVDSSSACDPSSLSSASTSAPPSPSNLSTSPVPRSNPSSAVAAHRHRLALGMASGS